MKQSYLTPEVAPLRLCLGFVIRLVTPMIELSGCMAWT